MESLNRQVSRTRYILKFREVKRFIMRANFSHVQKVR